MLNLDKKLADSFKRALEIVDKVKECTRESASFLVGLEGGYIEPGASGCLTRGKIEVLPTGRNFFAVDPTIIPTPAAWKIGIKTAEKLIKYYLDKHGRYPENIGHWLWSIDAYQSDGEQLAQLLYLIGVRPKWNPDSSIKEVEVIPLNELGRPRIDSTVRLSGILRDTLPNYIYLIDEAISKVVLLDEPLEWNYVKKHYLEHLSTLIELGKGSEEASELAKLRVYCSPPGAYSAGVNYAVEASAWKTDEDLAKTWVKFNCYAYSRKLFGKPSPETLLLNIKTVDVVTRDHVADEFDLLNCCCYYATHGGFLNTVKALSGRNDVEIVVVDTKDVTSLEVREMKDEIERVVRAKLLNPLWISEMKKHSYRGANEFSRKILHLYGWSATTKLVDNWVFDEIASIYVLSEDMRKWFEENNIWALEEITRRLVEAAERGLWKPSEEVLQRLEEAYAEIEGILEETVTGEVQGGLINVYGIEDVKEWSSKMEDIVSVWKKLKER